MNGLEVFSNNEFGEVRTVLVDGEPMFCLADICKALEIKNSTDVAKRLDEDKLTRLNLGSRSGETNFVTESGLYSVILRSDKPNAKAFRKWITWITNIFTVTKRINFALMPHQKPTDCLKKRNIQVGILIMPERKH